MIYEKITFILINRLTRYTHSVNASYNWGTQHLVACSWPLTTVCACIVYLSSRFCQDAQPCKLYASAIWMTRWWLWYVVLDVYSLFILYIFCMQYTGQFTGFNEGWQVQYRDWEKPLEKVSSHYYYNYV